MQKTIFQAVVLISICALSVMGTAPGLQAAKPAAPEVLYGNNLSLPVIFAEGVGLTGLETSEETGLRGTSIPYLVEPYSFNGETYYLQQTINSWQADWTNGASDHESVRVDWSDNIVRQTWTETSVIRVETVLFQDTIPPLNGYETQYLFGEGIEEVWGTTGNLYPANHATVYAIGARLVIDKLDSQGGNVIGTLYSSAIYERFGVDGRTDAYSAEVNVPGKIIYGYNWDLAHFDMASIGLPDEPKSGWYRLTFSLDPVASWQKLDETGNEIDYEAPNNTLLAAIDPGDQLGNIVPEVVLYEPQLSGDKATYIEIYIATKRTGKQ